MLAVPGDTAIDVRVFVGELAVTELPHPVVASTSASRKGTQND
jgi:hypothetical protein